MQAVEHAITGARYSSQSGNPGSTPEAALEQFHAAFNGRDPARMAAVLGSASGFTHQD
jgi:hypothetical protein